MEPAIRKQTSPLETSVLFELFDTVWEFDFPQAVRILQSDTPERRKIGDNDNPSLDPLYFRAHIDFNAPSSELKSLKPSASGHASPTLTVTFLGIAGIQGALPDVYSEIIIDRTRRHDFGIRDFLDIFNHRIITLWFKLYSHVYPGLRDLPLSSTAIGKSMLDLSGGEYLESGPKLMPFGPILWQKPKSLIGLESIIQNYFRVPCTIRAFEGKWNRIQPFDQTRLGLVHHELGASAILGKMVYDQAQGLRFILGPLTYAQFKDFLPSQKKTSGYGMLREIIHAYFETPIYFKIELILKKEEVPTVQLNGKYALGLNTWLKPCPVHLSDRSVLFPWQTASIHPQAHVVEKNDVEVHPPSHQDSAVLGYYQKGRK